MAAGCDSEGRWALAAALPPLHLYLLRAGCRASRGTGDQTTLASENRSTDWKWQFSGSAAGWRLALVIGWTESFLVRGVGPPGFEPGTERL
jgi:hypothetical protein